ncbi:unnamed protein product, partial [Porites lobata]
QVDYLVDEGKELIRKRQKLNRIADKSADGWKVVDEYVSDELASGSEDEKGLKKASEVASRKRRQPRQGCRGPDKDLYFDFLFALSQFLSDLFWSTLFVL